MKTEGDWSEHCGESFRGICLVALLAPSSESALRGSETIQSAMALIGKSGSAFRFLAVDAVCQQEFSGFFGVQGHELPTVAIYSPSKRRYQLMKGSFSDVSGWLPIYQLLLSLIILSLTAYLSLPSRCRRQSKSSPSRYSAGSPQLCPCRCAP